MSQLLYKIGRSAFAKPWYFIGAWVAILVVVITMVGVNGISVSTDIKIEGTESQTVIDKLSAEMPAAAGGQASIVFKAPEGESLQTPERQAAIAATVQKIYGIDSVISPADMAAAAGQSGDAAGAAGADGAAGAAGADAGATSADASGSGSDAAAAGGDGSGGSAAGGDAAQLPYGPLVINGQPVPGALIATDGSVALFQFQFMDQLMSLPEGVLAEVKDAAMTAGDGTGIVVLPSSSLNGMESPIGSKEILGILIAAMVLIIALGSVVAAGLPLITALIGVGVGVGGAYALSSVIPMNSMTPVLALMIGLAVGIDYALFIVNRQRRLIFDQKLPAGEAAGRAIGTAGSAVFFAGLTVIIALCGLAIIGISFLTTMALVAAATVAIAVMIALTLLPALLGLVGERICSPKARAKRDAKTFEQRHGFAQNWVTKIVKFRWAVVAGVVVLLGVVAVPIASMNLGMPSGATANLDTTDRQSYDAVAGAFGDGYNSPLIVVAEPTADGETLSQPALQALTGQIQSMDDVAVVQLAGMNATGDTAIISVIPKSGPDAQETKDLVTTLRAVGADDGGEIKLGVTGMTASQIDISQKMADVFPIYVVIILVLSLIILLLVFRSILVPIKATVGFLLSVLATFGITTAVFQWGWFKDLLGFDTGGPILSFLPIIVTGILYGLAMDYEVFLVSSMRESYVHGHKGTSAVKHGFEQSSRVVVAAAIIMVSVFAGFIFSHDAMIKQIGFALAIGILIDAFLVRMTLVPAVMALFGDKAWALPKWLDRFLPNLDVEGDKLIAALNERDGKTADTEKPLVNA